jgi:hypothetical protein
VISVTDTTLRQSPWFSAFVLAAAMEFIRQYLMMVFPLKS